MRHRTLFVVVVCVVVLSLIVDMDPAAAQVTIQKPVSSSQRQNAERIRDLMQEIRELMGRLPADAQVKLERELGICEPVVFSAINAGPMDDSRLGDAATSAGATVLVFDMRGKGRNLDGRATIRIGGTLRETRWTLPGRGNGYLMVDATAVRVTGFELFTAEGRTISGLVLVSDGVRLKTPGGRTQAVNDPWDHMRLFDTTGDQRLAPSDPVWRYLKIFLDDNGDGRVAAAEIRSMEDQDIRRINLDRARVSTDPKGNVWSYGTFTTSREMRGNMAGVTLRSP